MKFPSPVSGRGYAMDAVTFYTLAWVCLQVAVFGVILDMLPNPSIDLSVWLQSNAIIVLSVVALASFVSTRE